MLREELQKRILVLDGAMGTVLQKYSLTPEDFGGVQGCYEVLNERRPDIIQEIHENYIAAGADMIETNSFNCNAISLKEYGLEDRVKDFAKKSVEIARKATEKFGKKVYVLGSVGPTNKSLSFPLGEIPYERNLSFLDLKEAYAEQIEALCEAGVDGLLLETMFDGLNAKAAVVAAEEVFENLGKEVPILISATVNKQGKLLTGQSIESLIVALDRPSILSFGFNCSFGAKDLVPLVKRIQEKTDKFISLYPNAGLPNQNGDYVETAEKMRDDLQEILEAKAINILGGCCGTSFEHIRAIHDLVQNYEPRIPKRDYVLRHCLSGNELYAFAGKFTQVGERNNISGSKLFRKMIEEQNYLKALDVARQQMEAGAKVLDINVDDGILNSKQEMERFLRVLQNDSQVSKLPIMIDSSDFSVIEIALQNTAGKAIVNSISLKEGEEEFLRKAKLIRKYGAAIVVMAFDEEGQGVSKERKVEICQRAHALLQSIGISDDNIVFDPNILSIGTGKEEDRYHGRDFLETISWLQTNLPNCGVVGGLSNLSFAFRGNNLLRAAFHHIFLEMARARGFNFAILNPKEAVPEWAEEEKALISSFILGENIDVDAILSLAFVKKQELAVSLSESPEDKLKKALIQGGSLSLTEEIQALLQKYSALEILENILMGAMQTIGELFEQGELYLPQLIRSASVMNQCVDLLSPHLEKVESSEKKGKILMATVDGDVHDIGKNIVATVLECNGYEVVDLGVMVPKDEIVKRAQEENVDVITLSGLISPSLKEMERVAARCKEEGLQVPLLIAGAASSKLHTGLKVLPNYDYSLHITDAVDTITTISKLLSTKRKDFLLEKQAQLQLIAKHYLEKEAKKEQKSFPYIPKGKEYSPKRLGKEYRSFPVSILEETLDWDMALYSLRVKNTSEEAKTLEDLKVIYEKLKEEKTEFHACFGYFKARKKGNLLEVEDRSFPIGEEFGQYIAEEDYIGAFVISLESHLYEDKYWALLEQILCNALAETSSAFLEKYVSEEIVKTFLRPAVGYPMLAEHALKEEVFALVEGTKTGAKLSASYAMTPLSTVCGFYLCHDQAKY